MIPDNRLFKEFIYVYSEMLKFLQGVVKNDIYIGIPMVFFIINVVNKQIQFDRSLSKKELMNPKLIPNSTFYRLFTNALKGELILLTKDKKYRFPFDIPPHLKVADLVEKKMIHVPA